MIRHVVLFSARDPKDLPTIRQGLETLRSIPHARTLSVTPNQKRDTLSSEIDLVVYAEFDGPEELEAFKAHPTYAEAIRIVRPLRDIRVVVDFDAEG